MTLRYMPFCYNFSLNTRVIDISNRLKRFNAAK
jgi:hypothetical protein